MPPTPCVQRLIKAIYQNGVRDEAVLEAIAAVPREAFVPPLLKNFAWEDRPLPIGEGQTISQPSVAAYMTELLEVLPTHSVLEIGTGSGYQAAVLALLGAHVYTVERRAALLVEAQRRFAELGLDRITARLGDGTQGWPEHAPFDRIMVTAGAEGREPPPALLSQLGVGGVLVIPLAGECWEQRLVRIRRSETSFLREETWPVRFVPLVADLPSGTRAPPGA